MSTLMIWFLLVTATAVFLSIDLSVARRSYRASRSRGHEWLPFLRWWAKINTLKLTVTGVVLLVLSLALALHGHTLHLPEFLSRFALTRKTRWGLGVALLSAAFVAFDFFGARRFYLESGRGRGEAGMRFYRWWLKKSALKFSVVGVVGCLALGGAWTANRYHLLRTKGESSGYLESARQYYGQKRFREASLELRNAVKQNSGDYEAYLWLARSLWQLGDGAGARDAYREAVRIEPKLYGGHLELARLSLALKSPDVALKEAEQALALAPKSAEPRLLLAQIYGAAGQENRALEQLQAAIGAELPTPELRQQLVVFLLRLRAYPDALKAAGLGLDKDPRDQALLYLQAQALEGLNRTGEAEAVLKAMAATDGTPNARLALGDLKVRQKEYPAALNEYEEALKLGPDHELAMNNYASLNAEHGFDMTRSAPLAARLYSRHPKDPVVADTLGWTLYRQGKDAEALPLLRQAAAGAPGNPVHRYHYGAALLKAGSAAAGRKELETSLKISGAFDGAEKARELLRKERS